MRLPGHLRRLRSRSRRIRRRLRDWAAWFWHRLLAEPDDAERLIVLSASATELLVHDPALRRLAPDVARVLSILLRTLADDRDLDGGDFAWP